MNIFDTIMFKSVLIVVKALRVTLSSIAMTQKHTQSAQNHLRYHNQCWYLCQRPQEENLLPHKVENTRSSAVTSFVIQFEKVVKMIRGIALTMKPNDVLMTNNTTTISL